MKKIALIITMLMLIPVLASADSVSRIDANTNYVEYRRTEIKKDLANKDVEVFTGEMQEYTQIEIDRERSRAIERQARSTANYDATIAKLNAIEAELKK